MVSIAVQENTTDNTGFICGHYYYPYHISDFSGLYAEDDKCAWLGHEFARVADKQKAPSLRFVAELQFKGNLILFYVKDRKIQMINWEHLPDGVITGKWSWQSKWCFRSVVAGELRTRMNMQDSAYRRIFQFVIENKGKLPIVEQESETESETESEAESDSNEESETDRCQSNSK